MSDPAQLLMLVFGGGAIMFVCSLWSACASSSTAAAANGSNDSLQTALLPGASSSRFTSHRLEAASRDAAEGFHACAFCGFENFKRVQFCTLCGDQIVAIAPPAAADASSQRGDFAKAIAPTAAVSKRQKRARTRKEWIRKMDIERQIYWYRDPKLVTTARSSRNSRGVLVFPGFVLQFASDALTPSPEQVTAMMSSASASVHAQPTTTIEIEVFPDDIEGGTLASQPAQQQRRTSTSTSAPAGASQPHQAPLSEAAVVQSLEVEVAFQTLVLVDAAAADATKMPLPRTPQDAVNREFEHWRETMKVMRQDFPTKFAFFVSNTATLLVQASKQYIKLNVMRDSVLQDSLQSLSIVPKASIRSVIRVEFVGEAGVDAGALQREWFVLLNQALADPASGVFTCVDVGEQIFYLNANSAHDIGGDHLLYYFGAGRLVGRSLLEGQVLNFHLALPLLKVMLGQPVSFQDLEFFDAEAYSSLKYVMNTDGAEALGLTFSIMARRGRGEELVEIDLIEHGRDIAVTDENKDLYLERRFRYLLFESVSSQLYAFLKGVYEIVPQELLVLFDPEELDYVLCGSDEIDVDDWEKHTRVSATLYGHKAVKWFWEFVREMPNEYRRRLLHFATGSSRVPLGGFAALTSVDGRICPFGLKGVLLTESEYIASHACFNRLDIPLYDSRVKMGTILFAILETELHGFTRD